VLRKQNVNQGARQTMRVTVTKEDIIGSGCFAGNPVYRALKRKVGAQVHYVSPNLALVDGQMLRLSPSLRQVMKEFMGGVLNTPRSKVQLPVKGLLRA
jgi:hypothetical protein